MSEAQDGAEGKAPKGFRLSWLHWAAIAVSSLLLLAAAAKIASLFGSNPVPPFIKDSSVYQRTLEKIKSSKAASDALGSPLDEGSYFSGSIEDGDKSGQAKFIVVFSGSKGKGVLSVEAVKAAGEWTFGFMELSPKGVAEPLNLLLDAP